MFYSSLKKEARIVTSDIHSIAVLLILPISFMLIMTFALSERQNQLIEKVSFYLDANIEQKSANLFSAYIQRQGLSIKTQQQGASIIITVLDDLDAKLLTNNTEPLFRVTYGAGVTPQMRNLAIEHIKIAFSKLKLHYFLIDSGELSEEESIENQIVSVEKTTDVESIFTIDQGTKTAASVMMFSIPSWIVFGIYFIVLPVSMTIIAEKQSGALIRLKTFPISASQFLFAKMSAFFSISLLQFALLLAVGLHIVPAITGEAAIAVESWLQMLMVILLICLSANCFAFVIGSLVNSYEQAIVVGGGINIILAALSGFMVPIDVMPTIMAEIAALSPLHWSAELIRLSINGTITSNFINFLIGLTVVSLVCFALAITIYNRKIRNLTWT